MDVSNTAPTTWYEAARNIDQNRASNEAFWSTHCTPTPLSSPLCLPVQTPFWPTQVHIRPTPGHPVPMDIDMSQRRALVTPTCYCCGKTGHKIPDCPLRFDIWVLTTEELEAELETRLARWDVVPVEDCPSTAEEVSSLDFLLDNKWIACCCCPLITTSMSCV